MWSHERTYFTFLLPLPPIQLKRTLYLGCVLCKGSEPWLLISGSPLLGMAADIRASVLFYCHVPWKRSFILLLEGRQMKLVLEYKVNPISESIAHGQMISVLSTLSERFPLSKLIINCWKNEGLLLCFMSLCSTPMLNAFHFLWQNSFSIDKVALRVFTGLCKHPHMAKLK